MKFQALFSSVACVFILSGCAQVVSQPVGPQLVLASAGKPLQAEPLRCEGVGIPECEKNWQMLQIGHSTADAGYWVGSGYEALQTVYIDRVENVWAFPSGGRLFFKNNSLVMVEPPATYLYPVDNAEIQTL